MFYQPNISEQLKKKSVLAVLQKSLNELLKKEDAVLNGHLQILNQYGNQITVIQPKNDDDENDTIGILSVAQKKNFSVPTLACEKICDILLKYGNNDFGIYSIRPVQKSISDEKEKLLNIKQIIFNQSTVDIFKALFKKENSLFSDIVFIEGAKDIIKILIHYIKRENYLNTELKLEQNSKQNYGFDEKKRNLHIEWLKSAKINCDDAGWQDLGEQITGLLDFLESFDKSPYGKKRKRDDDPDQDDEMHPSKKIKLN